MNKLKIVAAIIMMGAFSFIFGVSDFETQSYSSFCNGGMVTAYAATQTYKVTYNANGGSGAPSSQTKTKGVTLRLSSTRPTRRGYKFLGWGLNRNSTYVSYLAGAVYRDDRAITLYAVWEADKYKITYNANGGSGAPSYQVKEYDKTVTISYTTPSRTGYRFRGWGLSSSTTTIKYFSGDRYTANSDVTLYALWEKRTYSIKYDANGGSGAPAEQTKTYNVTMKISSAVPVRKGYDFMGWGKDRYTSTVSYKAGANYTANEDIMLYAVWTKSTYIITYNANGGNGAPSAQTKTYGNTLTLSYTRPSWNGREFQGWGLSASTTAVSYKPGAAYNDNKAVTLYAVWKKVTYAVTYNANGGNGAPSEQQKIYDETLTLSSIVPERTGYDFVGWNTSSSASTASYQPGSVYRYNAKLSLYAVWKKKTYIITYNANGGNGAPSQQTKTHGSTLYLSNTVPTKTGYDFQGWALTSNSTSVKYQKGASYTTDASATLFAVWKIKTYTVTYDANGGSGAPSKQTKKHGTSLTLTYSKPSRSGYKFLGWNTSSSANSPSYSAGSRYTDNKDLLLYAVWESQTVIIRYDANGGSGAPSQQTKTVNVTITLSTVKPSRTGHQFLGWSTSNVSQTVQYNPGDSYSSNSAATLYAVWKPDTYPVIYDANGGSGAPASQMKVYGVPLNISSSIPVRTGYDFVGWSASSGSEIVSYNTGGYYTKNAPITLYAVWKLKTFTISYNGNGGSGVPGVQTKTYGAAVTLPASVPVRTGHSFLGWSSGGTTGSVNYYPGSRYTTESSVVMYAIWKPDTYMVSYNANGGNGAPASQVKTYGVTLTLSTQVPVKNGYTFMGWAVAAGASSAKYSAGGSYTDNNGTVLYAVWRDTKVDGISVSAVNNEDGSVTITGSSNDIVGIAAYSWTTGSAIPSTWNTVSTRNSLSTQHTVGSSESSGRRYFWIKDISGNIASTSVMINKITYSSNGGSTAPASQMKAERKQITLSRAMLRKRGSEFLGWSEDRNAGIALYLPGQAFTRSTDTVLYAVFRYDAYDFVLTGLSISPAEVYSFSTVTVSCTVSNKDKYTDYTGIPVELLYKGSIVKTVYVSLLRASSKRIELSFDIGDDIGEKNIEVRINYNGRTEEDDSENNSMLVKVEVKENNDLTAEAMIPVSAYRAGNEVITSFTVKNEGGRDLLPDKNVAFHYEVYYMSGAERITVTDQSWENVVIPSRGQNIVYFKWRIPEGVEGAKLYCIGKINSSNSLHEINIDNNESSFTITVSPKEHSQAPDAVYSAKAPAGYVRKSPVQNNGKVEWSIWVYETGTLKQKHYGLEIGGDKPVITPDDDSGAYYAGGRWYTKSGYGLSISCSPEIKVLDGCEMPDESSYTKIQSVTVRFPEYNYQSVNGRYRTLELERECFVFEENEAVTGKKRIHFIPVWFPDGDYTVSVTAGDVWTPAGVINVDINSNSVIIAGTMYSDWYYRK